MVYMYHSFLIHSSADGHLGCFRVLAMINSAATNIGVHVSLSDLVSLQKDSLLFQPPGKPTHNISISIYRYTYIQNTHSAYLYLYLYTHTCNTHTQHVYMHIYIFIYTERLIYYKELAQQLWRQRSPMICSVSWRHREASGVIPVWVPRPKNQDNQWCKSQSEGKRILMSPFRSQAEREHILPSSAFVFSLDLQLIGRGPPSRRRTICLIQPTDSHANTIQRYLENTPRNND